MRSNEQQQTYLDVTTLASAVGCPITRKIKNKNKLKNIESGLPPRATF